MPESYGLIVGSGWEPPDAMTQGIDVTTTCGTPSAPVYRRTYGGRTVLTLARHGDKHTIPPHRINYRANILALRELGAETIIGLNTVGVVTGIAAPGQIAVPDQLIDYTWGREHTLFGDDRQSVEHIDFTFPFTAALRNGLLQAADRAGVACCDGGVYATTQGPRLETAAEVERLARDGADFIGMTAMPEAAIAREAGVDYACIAMIVNHAAGRSDAPILTEVDAYMHRVRDATRSTLEAFFAAL